MASAVTPFFMFCVISVPCLFSDVHWTLLRIVLTLPHVGLTLSTAQRSRPLPSLNKLPPPPLIQHIRLKLLVALPVAEAHHPKAALLVEGASSHIALERVEP